MRRSRIPTLRLLIALLSSAPTGCTRPAPLADRAPPSEAEVAQVIKRTGAVFTNAIYYKPIDSEPDAVRRMAPLLVQGVPDGSSLRRPPRIAPAATPNSQPILKLDHSTATVVAGRHSQLAWTWQFSSSERVHCGHGRPIAQAVRMSLDSTGSPVIWEVFDCRERYVVVFVAKSLESAALRAYGAALPGRRFAVERSAEEQPNVIVAGVLEDGPEPMGPFVYLDETCRITTILCRCMPARFENAVETIIYRIETSVGSGSPPGRTEQQSRHREWQEPDWLERALRLPPHF